jgi:hypothetical protein
MFTIEGVPEAWKMRALARFMSKIDDSNGTGCWEWTGSMMDGGYGQFFYGSIQGKERNGKAHKAAWVLLKGPVPEGMLVLHKCHNRRCCNPDHLYLGTHMDNMKDRDEAGRTSRGAHRYNFKRDEELNTKIGQLRAQGLRIDMICEQLGIGRTTYYRCVASGAVDPEANRMARSANGSAAQATRRAA